MPALPRKLAAAQLGIKVSKLRRLTADGTGKVKQGSRGRGKSTLYDTAILAQLLHAPLSAEVLEDIRRGQLALTLIASLEIDLAVLEHEHELHKYGLPWDSHTKVIEFLRQWFRSRAESHLRIPSALMVRK